MTAPPTEEATRRPPSRVWSAVGVFGELLITVGVLLLLFVAYQLMWTNVTAQRASDQIATDLQDSWAMPATDGSSDPGDPGDLAVIPRPDRRSGTPSP